MRRLLGVLLATAVLVIGACGDGDDDPPPAADGGDCTTDTKMDVYSTDGEGVVHTDHPSYTGPLSNPPTYTVDPPSGGDHLSPSVGPGLYSGDNVPPDGVLVHSLEHGYVILWYRADEDEGVVRAAQQEHPRDTIVVQRPSLSVPVAATAWGRRLLCQEVDADTLAAFVREARNKAPEKVAH